jgi:hypothetical protein
MRFGALFISLLVLACSRDAEQAHVATSAPDTLAPPAPPPAPVGLYGDWLRVAPPALAGDTLRLSADSTAAGVVPWPPQTRSLARITRWHVRYASRDPVVDRADWRQGHTDGGDADCFLRREPNPSRCRSLPLICLGGLTQFSCEKFVYTPDSLLFSTGLRYVRIHPVTAAAPLTQG